MVESEIQLGFKSRGFPRSNESQKWAILSGALHKRTEQKQIRDKVSKNTHFEGYLNHLLYNHRQT